MSAEIDFLTTRSAVIAADCADQLASAGKQSPPTTDLRSEASAWVRVGAAPGCLTGLVRRSALDDPMSTAPIAVVSTEGGTDVVGFYIRGVGMLSPSEMKTSGIDIERLPEAMAEINRVHGSSQSSE